GERLVRRNRQRVLERALELRWNVLHERAATRDVQDLDSTADREDGEPARTGGSDQGHLELVAPWLGLDESRVGGLSISGRLHIVAPRKKQPVQPVQSRIDCH